MLISRRIIQTVLGIIWFIDGLLQLKPQMSTKVFLSQVVLPTAQSQPSWIAHSITWAANVVAPHIGVYDAIFALIQLLIGLALIFNLKVRTTLTISLIWALIVWWFGEGFGQLLTGQAILITGAPGAVFLYGIIGWAIWPKEDGAGQFGSVSVLGMKIARCALGVLWILGAVLQFQPAYLSAEGLSGTFTAQWMANAVGSHGAVVSIALAVIQLIIGIAILMSWRVRPFMWASIVLSFFFWWVGQSFGQMFSSLGTDPNAGPLFILLTLCACPFLLQPTHDSVHESFHNGNAS